MKMERSGTLKVLAISSLPTVGNAGLINLMSILGGHVLPIPTLVISGLGNMEGNQRFVLPFRDILAHTFEMAQRCDYSLLVYTGYFNQAEQIQETIEILHTFQDSIHQTIVDPISGDNGKPYVDQAIIEELPKLSRLADWVLPNETELKLLLNLPMETPLKKAVQQFRDKFPEANLLVTGIKTKDQIGNYLMTDKEAQLITHDFHDYPYSGTGDAFAAFFMKYRFFKKRETLFAIKKAGEQLSHLIHQSIEAQKPAFDLMLSPYKQEG